MPSKNVKKVETTDSRDKRIDTHLANSARLRKQNITFKRRPQCSDADLESPLCSRQFASCLTKPWHILISFDLKFSQTGAYRNPQFMCKRRFIYEMWTTRKFTENIVASRWWSDWFSTWAWCYNYLDEMPTSGFMRWQSATGCLVYHKSCYGQVVRLRISLV